MSKESNISYLRKLICYFKSREVSPTADEEDRLWNSIMSEITISRRRRKQMAYFVNLFGSGRDACRDNMDASS